MIFFNWINIENLSFGAFLVAWKKKNINKFLMYLKQNSMFFRCFIHTNSFRSNVSIKFANWKVSCNLFPLTFLSIDAGDKWNALAINEQTSLLKFPFTSYVINFFFFILHNIKYFKNVWRHFLNIFFSCIWEREDKSKIGNIA